MLPQWTIITIVCIVAAIIFIFGIATLLMKFYRKVEQGNALIINKLGEIPIVTFTGGVAWPIIHKAEIMDISVKAMEIERSSKNGLICEDNIRADIRVTFYIRVNKTKEDVLKVAQSVGCKRASIKETLEELFQAKFSEALKTVGKQMEFITLFTERVRFKEEIIKVIGEDLNGYKLEDVAIDYLEQTPLISLNPDNIMDAQGIRKIICETAEQAKLTNALTRDKEKVIKQEDVETREKILELERQEADAEAKQQREIAIVRAREQAEAKKVEAEESRKAEEAQITKEEAIAIANENKERQIEVAAKAKERTIVVETERVTRDAQLESVERERLVELKTIEKEKAVEVEKKKIQDVIRERVMVEKTVAAEQEKIKDTVQIATAERDRNVQVIGADREAEKLLIQETKAAEAKERAAKSIYEETVTIANAEKIKAEKEAEAKKNLAEGIVAVKSADGLAKVKVREAEANVIELEGKAKASAEMNGHKAGAFGLEANGEAEAKALEIKAKAHAKATETQGTADASATEVKMLANAEGTKAQGEAEAAAMLAKYSAEAKGIDEKADAMKKFDGVGREHEEFKLELGKEERIELAGIDVNRKIAEAQAEILGEAMKQANIDIVGGDGEFLDKFFKSISLGKSVDAFIKSSDVANKFLIGEEGDTQGILYKLKDLIAKEGLKAGDIKDLSVSALLTRLALEGKTTGIKKEAGKLQELAKGVDMKDLMALWMANK